MTKEINMQLLQDTFIIENLQVLSEGKASDKMKIKGVFGRCNEKNNNGRIYPTAVLESQLNKVQPMISERRLCGELDHPQNDTVKLSNASHLITKLEMKGDELIGEAEILNTPAGLTAAALVNGGVKIGISSRGMGTLSENETGDKIVNEDFRLVTFDLVADPSTRGAYPGLSESTESQYVRETQGKLTKESNFVTMLEAKMRDAYKPFIEEKKKLSAAQKANMDVEPEGGDGDIDAKDLKKLRSRKNEAMDMIRKDGHWHRIAEMIAVGFGHDIAESVFDPENGSGQEGSGESSGGRGSGSTRNLKAQAGVAKAKASQIKQQRKLEKGRKGPGIFGKMAAATGDRLAKKISTGGDIARDKEKATGAAAVKKTQTSSDIATKGAQQRASLQRKSLAGRSGEQQKGEVAREKIRQSKATRLERSK